MCSQKWGTNMAHVVLLFFLNKKNDFLFTTFGYRCVQGNFRFFFLNKKKKTQTNPTPCINAKFLNSLCLTAIRSLRISCEESLQDEHEVSTSSLLYFFVVFCYFLLLSIIYILNAIALNFPAHVRWEAVHLSCPVAWFNVFHCARK